MNPYYDDGSCVIYHGDCAEILPQVTGDLLVTDPPYPNNAGWFDDAIELARTVVADVRWREAVVFWTELEPPPLRLPAVAVHVWHRSNVNGRPYESAYHFAADGRKRRSEVMAHPAVFDGAGPGCHEYLGHPTQKPVALMGRLIRKTVGSVVIDPFMGSGTTLRAAKDCGRKAVGIEIEERYCEIAARRMSQEVLDFTLDLPERHTPGQDQIALIIDRDVAS